MRISDWSSDVCSSDLRPVVLALDALLDPQLLRRILDVHVFDRDRTAVGLLEPLHDLPQGRGLEAEDVVDEDRPVPVVRNEQIGRASCRERVRQYVSISVVDVSLKTKIHITTAHQHNYVYLHTKT